jgi:hypothetical protein
MSQKQSVENGPSHAQVGTAAPSVAPSNPAVTHLKEELAHGTRDVAGELKHVAVDVAGEAKKAAASKLGAGKEFAAEHLGSVAHALRQTGRQLHSQESGIGEYVDKVASSIDGVSNYLQTRTLSQLMGDVEGYARREPAIFLGGAFIAGLLGGRFLKSATPSTPRSETAQQASFHNGGRVLPQRSEAPRTTLPAATQGRNDMGSMGGRSTPSEERPTRPQGSTSTSQYSQVPQDKSTFTAKEKPSDTTSSSVAKPSSMSATGSSPPAARTATGSATPTGSPQNPTGSPQNPTGSSQNPTGSSQSHKG